MRGKRYEYGVILNSRETDDTGYMCCIDAQGGAMDAEYEELAE